MDGWNAGQLILILGFGVQELLLILLVVVFLFGAKKIPEIARGLGKGMSEFKKGMQDGEAEGDDEKDAKPKSDS